jgi:sodium transport system ATP-binding protein
VVVENLGKTFGAFVAVRDLSLHVGAGEIYGLLGPNGAGKTTTLRTLAGLLTPTRGRVMVAGFDVALDPDRAKGEIGFLTGTTGLYARLTAREMLIYFGLLYGMPADLLARRIEEVARTLEVTAVLDRRCEALSTGERQRVSVARSVLHDPPVLILDEPTIGLDVLASRFLRVLLRSERARGKAIIFSTHYLAEAELLCDRVGLLYRGHLLREGTPAVLRDEARTATLEEAFLRLVAAEDALVAQGRSSAEIFATASPGGQPDGAA